MVGRRRYPLHFGIHNQSIHLRHGHPPRLLRSHHRRFILIAAGLHHIAPRGKVITATAVTAATILISILSAVIPPQLPGNHQRNRSPYHHQHRRCRCPHF